MIHRLLSNRTDEIKARNICNNLPMVLPALQPRVVLFRFYGKSIHHPFRIVTQALCISTTDHRRLKEFDKPMQNHVTGYDYEEISGLNKKESRNKLKKYRTGKLIRRISESTTFVNK